jgi:hypothetical protein
MSVIEFIPSAGAVPIGKTLTWGEWAIALHGMVLVPDSNWSLFPKSQNFDQPQHSYQ